MRGDMFVVVASVIEIVCAVVVASVVFFVVGSDVSSENKVSIIVVTFGLA